MVMIGVVVVVNMCVETSGSKFTRGGVEGNEMRVNEIMNTGNTTRPVVLWHGMGDACCEKRSLGPVVQRVKKKLGADARVESLVVASGQDVDDDASTFAQVYSSFFGNALEQVDAVCAYLSSKYGTEPLNLVGFSQGGQLLRALVQRCDTIGVHNLITLGAQHQGVMTIPGCTDDTHTPSGRTSSGGSEGSMSSDDVVATATATSAAGSRGGSWGLCAAMQRLVGIGAYTPVVQTRSIQAQYFKDPYKLEAYTARNIFLADINNERDGKEPDLHYAERLGRVNQLVMFRFDNDTTVVPRDSAWFSFFNGTALVPMEETGAYDALDLRALNEQGKIARLHSPFAHMAFSLNWFESSVIEPFLMQ